jgi:peptidoglycan/xylan/chitin deacetylase (PgdA/CDA1 family)
VNASLKRAVAWGLLRSGALSLHRSGFERRRAIILTYHRVNDERDPFFPATPTEEFTQQVEYLARRYRVAPLDSVVEWLEEGGQGPPRLALTIDDGYRDTHDVVLPVLERLGVPAMLYLSTAPPETGRPLWTDRVRALFKRAERPSLEVPELGTGLDLSSSPARLASLSAALRTLKRASPAGITSALARIEEQIGGGGPEPRVLDWDAVRRLTRQVVSLGAHTHNHYLLSRLDDAEVSSEIETSVRLIRERTGAAVQSFAYPNGEAGDYDQRSIDVLRRLGLRSAVTCRLGFARPGGGRYELPRLYAREPFLAVFATRVAGLTPEIRQASR